MKTSKDGKTENITIKVTEELRLRIEKLWKSNLGFSSQLFSSFLAYLIGVGVEEEELRALEKQKRSDARVNAAAAEVEKTVHTSKK
jgi:hypothetical protein